MKKATAILLQNMLARIKNLEKQVEDVILNSTSEFQQLSKQIKSLNKTINNINRTKGVNGMYYEESIENNHNEASRLESPI